MAGYEYSFQNLASVAEYWKVKTPFNQLKVAEDKSQAQLLPAPKANILQGSKYIVCQGNSYAVRSY